MLFGYEFSSRLAEMEQLCYTGSIERKDLVVPDAMRFFDDEESTSEGCTRDTSAIRGVFLAQMRRW